MFSTFYSNKCILNWDIDTCALIEIKIIFLIAHDRIELL